MVRSALVPQVPATDPSSVLPSGGCVPSDRDVALLCLIIGLPKLRSELYFRRFLVGRG